MTLAGSAWAMAQAPPGFSVRIDAGADRAYTDPAGRVYLPDQAWMPESPLGYVGGRQEVYGFWQYVDGTLDEELHRHQRLGWQEYRFGRVPDGDYLVTLSFSLVGFQPDAAFGLAIEGQTVLDEFSISSHVGRNYALERRFAVRVTDGELNVVSLPVVGEPRLSAIVVEARSPDSDPPPTPAELATTSSYNTVLLDWADVGVDDLDGYHVYRAAAAGGPYTRLTAEPLHVSWYEDVVTATHAAYHYRVSAVDVYGNQSDRAPQQPGLALDASDAALPLFDLQVPADNLRSLESDPLADEEVTGTLTYRGQTYPIEIRYRGSYGRWVNKRSWKIRFPERSPFIDQDEINVRADYADWSMMRSKLASDLFEAMGVPSLRATHCLLILNGRYLGVHTCVEQMGQGFLERAGWDSDASIYKVIRTDANDYSRVQPSEREYRAAFQKEMNQDTGYADIIRLIELVNVAPDETFAYELGRVLDVAAYLDYYTVIVLTNNADFVPHNVYLVHDLAADRWELVPYDLDRAFSSPRPEWGIPYHNAIDMGTLASPALPWGFSSLLLTRVLDVPQFRAYYCHRLAEAMNTVFADAVMHPSIDALHAAIEQDGLRDWQKYRRQDHEWFLASPAEIKAYVTQRKAFLWQALPGYCPADDRAYLFVNEVMRAGRVLEDPDEPGEFPPWFEIYNAGLEAVDLSGTYLTDDLADPAKFRIADGVVIPAGGFITFFADGEPDQGARHTNFRLDQASGQVGIFRQGRTVDVFTFGPLPAGLSQGRYPDGADGGMAFHVPSPGRSNLLRPPTVGATEITPRLPTVSDAVTVTARVTDDGALLAVTLFYSVTGSGFVQVPMTNLRDDLYAAQIPPQPGGCQVAYFVAAEDADGQTGADPSGRASDPHSYLVGYSPPVLFVNEFMAANETVLADPDEAGEFPDWIELYNPGPDPVDLGGRYLTDDLSHPTKFRIADGLVVPAGGCLLFYADGDPEQGPRHTNFELNRGGESVGLFDTDAAGNLPIDAHTFGPQVGDTSEGRYPNGGDHWIAFYPSTPGRASVAGTYLPLLLKRRMD